MSGNAAAEGIPHESAPLTAGHQASACPLCGQRPELLFLSRREVAAELAERACFFALRLDGAFSHAQLRDLTNVLLGTPAAILRCAGCDVLVREGAPDDGSFRDDRYDDGLLDSLHRTHAMAFRAKEDDYRSLLPRGARVVEIGSYVAGFLRAATEWGWTATGIDIGRDTTRFSRHLGFDARCVDFEESALEDGSLDGVFVWNCFEQLSAPDALVAEARRTLRRGGLLVLRVPDAGFYIRCQRESRDAIARAILGYNNLLGWPYRFGLDVRSLRRMTREHGFALRRVLRRPAVRPLRTAMQAWAQAEESKLITEEQCGWIELTLQADGRT